jgi:hypothetical protein
MLVSIDDDKTRVLRIKIKTHFPLLCVITSYVLDGKSIQGKTTAFFQNLKIEYTEWNK